VGCHSPPFSVDGSLLLRSGGGSTGGRVGGGSLGGGGYIQPLIT